MRIWVTGARGFIGRHVAACAALAGHEVWAVVRPGAPAIDRLPPGVWSLALKLDDRVQVASSIEGTRPDAIIHLAWYAQPQDYLTSPDNIESLATTLAFARAALISGCRKMVGVGTCLEYADLPRPRAEDDPIDPKSLYARCKRAAHLVLAELFEQTGASLAWARLFHIHGPGEHRARLIPTLAGALRQGSPFDLSPGEQMRDHLDVRDVASALVQLAGWEGAGPVNVCSGKPVTLRTVMEIVARQLGHPELLRFGKRGYREGEVMNLTGVPERLLQTGWRPVHSDLAKSIRDTVDVREDDAVASAAR